MREPNFRNAGVLWRCTCMRIGGRSAPPPSRNSQASALPRWIRGSAWAKPVGAIASGHGGGCTIRRTSCSCFAMSLIVAAGSAEHPDVRRAEARAAGEHRATGAGLLMPVGFAPAQLLTRRPDETLPVGSLVAGSAYRGLSGAVTGLGVWPSGSLEQLRSDADGGHRDAQGLDLAGEVQSRPASEPA